MRKFIAAAGATLLTGGLFAQTVTRDYDHSVDFASLKKFGWIQRDTLPIFRADPSEHDPAADAALNRLILDSLKSHLEKKALSWMKSLQTSWSVTLGCPSTLSSLPNSASTPREVLIRVILRTGTGDRLTKRDPISI